MSLWPINTLQRMIRDLIAQQTLNGSAVDHKLEGSRLHQIRKSDNRSTIQTNSCGCDYVVD